jgi:hypothetical protein
LFRAQLPSPAGTVRDRAGGEGERQALIQFSILLFNLAGFYLNAERFDDAVRAFEEVVALDELTGHTDLESDRQALAQARQLAALTPEQRAQLQPQANQSAAPPALDEAALQAQLAQLPPEQRAAMEAQLRQAAEQFARLSPQEREALAAQAQRTQIEDLVNQTRTAAYAALRGEHPRERVAARLTEVAGQIQHDFGGQSGPQAGAWQDLAAYLRAVAAVLSNEPPPPVPMAYAAHLALIQQAAQS